MYDYVIVGAGSAGCVLANRLTEDPAVSVLLLESGGPDTARELHIPAAFSKLFKGAYDWSYSTEEQEQLKQRRIYMPRGKALGGSSSINAMIYMRGNRYDYDHWCDLGNQGWSYSEVLPYFKKAEHQERGVSDYHGVDGPLNVADPRCVNPLTHAFVAAGIELGWPHNSDFNGEEQEGVGVYQVTQMGISVTLDLPGVGQNLQDHLAAGVIYACTKPVSLAGAETLTNMLYYLLFKRGPLTTSVTEAGAFLRTKPDLPAPDIQVAFVPVDAIDHGLVRLEGHSFTIGLTQLRPQSRGQVTLRSSDPLEPPVIQPGYLTGESELQTLVEGIGLCRKVAQAKAFDPFRGRELYPAAEVQGETAIADYVRTFAVTADHPVGTCKMGNDALAVVDASIMPEIVSGNTNAPTIMIAEKAADLIKKNKEGH